MCHYTDLLTTGTTGKEIKSCCSAVWKVIEDGQDEDDLIVDSLETNPEKDEIDIPEGSVLVMQDKHQDHSKLSPLSLLKNRWASTERGSSSSDKKSLKGVNSKKQFSQSGSPREKSLRDLFQQTTTHGESIGSKNEGGNSVQESLIKSLDSNEGVATSHGLRTGSSVKRPSYRRGKVPKWLREARLRRKQEHNRIYRKNTYCTRWADGWYDDLPSDTEPPWGDATKRKTQLGAYTRSKIEEYKRKGLPLPRTNKRVFGHRCPA